MKRIPIRDHPAEIVPVSRVFSRTFADYLLSPEFVPLTPPRHLPRGELVAASNGSARGGDPPFRRR